MNSAGAAPEKTIFYVGHHETRREYEISEEVLHHAQDLNYDMLTAPITNDAFHSRVLTSLSTYFSSLSETDAAPESVSGQADIPASPTIANLTPDETSLRPEGMVGQLIFTASPWIDLASSDPVVADISRQVLLLEVAYASFCGATNIIINGPSAQACGHGGSLLAQYARSIHDALGAGGYVNMQIMLPVCYDADDDEEDIGSLSRFAREPYLPQVEADNGNDPLATWDAWNVVRSMCRYSSRLSVALTVSKQSVSKQVGKRWFSEPVRILVIPGSSFLHNGANKQTSLGQDQRQFLAMLMRSRAPPWILLSNVGPLPGMDGSEDDYDMSDDDQEPTPAQAASFGVSVKPAAGSYLKYLRRLEESQSPKTLIERFGVGYQDFLQNPLQPLTDNLESITYEVFEKDPIKYDWYERAIAHALQDWSAQRKPASGPDGRVVVAVVGAGRGPLVTRALRASKDAGVDIEMWAVEKNQNAFVLLQSHNLTKWSGRVNLVHSDMRSWNGPQYSSVGKALKEPASSPMSSKIDILVSELLGSFGDNELSPECLDGVQHLLNPSHGISIPSSYTAHLTPIAAPKLHADVTARAAGGVPDAAQIPYVVMLHAIDYLSASTSTKPTRGEEQPNVLQVWEFKHPVPPKYLIRPPGGSATASGNEHNRRFSRLEFPCQQQGMCHGLAGYFETVLYKGDKATVELSTNPVTMDDKSKDMISWFPAYLPLKNPLYVPSGAVLVVNIWRQTDGRKVWYEWLVEVFLTINNGVPGRVRGSASELHSSVANACLM